mmetsp:Transcript_34509/g.83948  ORF Transcript_34509/g.83948 Transcript_34509/m.83948 type:complete len:112 (-) Transcript_34509:299-634(-)
MAMGCAGEGGATRLPPPPQQLPTSLLYTTEGSEECDDGNSFNGDGCDNTCLIKDPSQNTWLCTTEVNQLSKAVLPFADEPHFWQQDVLVPWGDGCNRWVVCDPVVRASQHG